MGMARCQPPQRALHQGAEDASRGGSKTKSQGRWRRTFTVPGTYRYICKLYTGMRGTITVQPAQPKT